MPLFYYVQRRASADSASTLENRTRLMLVGWMLLLSGFLLMSFKLKDYKMIIKLLGKFIYLLYREVMTLKQKEADSRSPIKINREAFKRQTSS